MNFLIVLKLEQLRNAEWHFGTKSKRNLTSAIKITRHYSNAAFLRFETKKELLVC